MAAPALTCFALGCCRWRDESCTEIEAEPTFMQRYTRFFTADSSLVLVDLFGLSRLNRRPSQTLPDEIAAMRYVWWQRLIGQLES